MDGKKNAMLMVFVFMLATAGALANAVHVYAEECIVMVSADGIEREICTDSVEPAITHDASAGERGIEPAIAPAPEDDPETRAAAETMPATLTVEEAMELAADSECTDESGLTGNCVYNEYTGTWWIDMEPVEGRENCRPACVVNDATGEAVINWRCMGAMPPEGGDASAISGIPEDSNVPHGGDPGMVIGISSPAPTAQAATQKTSAAGPIDALMQAIMGFFQQLFGG